LLVALDSAFGSDRSLTRVFARVCTPSLGGELGDGSEFGTRGGDDLVASVGVAAGCPTRRPAIP